MSKLRILFDEKSAGVVPSVKEALNDVFGIKTSEELQLNPAEVKGAYNTHRQQYNGSKLLNYLIRSLPKAQSSKDSGALYLWILSNDIYVEGMNFVFGVAHSGKAAVLSIHRLDSLELINKEAIHELGHVFGLQHCSNDCVMQFSNSLAEAKAKTATFCARCKSLITTL